MASKTLKTEILFAEFHRRQKANVGYSSRAFARDIGVSHTYLSLLKKGQRHLTSKICAKIYPRLKLNKKEAGIFTLGLQEAESTKREKISLQKFAMISDWPYYAVLSLLDIKGFQWDANWIAKRLGITKSRASFIMQGLIDQDMIEKTETGYKQKPAPIVVENKAPAESASSFNRRLIQKGLESMQTRDFKERDLSSIVFAMDPEYLEYAIERIRNFRRSLAKELETVSESKEVYALAVQLFPLTEKDSL